MFISVVVHPFLSNKSLPELGGSGCVIIKKYFEGNRDLHCT
jgi:hypothetical protein